MDGLRQPRGKRFRKPLCGIAAIRGDGNLIGVDEVVASVEEPIIAGASETGRAPIFLLSFLHRDELGATVSRAGWSVVAARRPEGVEQRLLASGAAVVLVDARGAMEEALAATGRLAGHVGARGGALIVLVSRNMVGSLGAFLSAGATHFLTSPISQSELVHGLRFAEAHCRRRMQGDHANAPGVLHWRWEPGRAVALSPALAAASDRGLTWATSEESC